jgi:hypothetical protein
MFNGGVRGKRAKDGVGFLSTAEQFNQKSFLVPTVTSFSVTDVSYVPLDNTAVDTAGGETIVINGSGFASGATVQVGATTIGSVTFVDQNRLAFTAPALSSGSYTIYVTNSNGGTGILLSGLVYSGVPTFTTTAGTLGTVYETANVNTAVVATGDAPITYSVISGTLPSGATLNSNGTITGNAPVDGSSTTYSFTIQATDGQLQDSTRAFTLTINTDVLSFGLANNTVYTLTGGTAISNVTLNATSSANANSAVTYAANTLPTGVSLSGNTIFGTPTVEQTVYTAVTATATQTGRTATRFVSWIVSVGDPFFKYVSLLLKGDGTNGAQNNTFLDGSTNNFAITRNGNTTQGTFSPYGANWSNYFDGSDYLSLADNANLNPGTQDFVMEAWVYLTGTTGNNQGINGKGTPGTDGYTLFVTDALVLSFIWNGTGGATITGGTLGLNTWNHVAVVRNNSVIRLYLNGVGAVSSTACTTDITSTATKFVGQARGGNPILGYMSNYRMTKNSLPAGYNATSSTLTVPTAPLTAISGTSLLTCADNRLVDDSTNNFTITKNGDVSVQRFSPFSPAAAYSAGTIGGGGYFDGTGDYLSLASNAAFTVGTGAVTIEAWIYCTSLTQSYQGIIGGRLQDAGTGYPGLSLVIDDSKLFFTIMGISTGLVDTVNVSLNQWIHVVGVRSGTNAALFVNGVRKAFSASNSTNGTTSNMAIGRYYSADDGYYFSGYISSARIVKGTAVYDPTVATLTVPTAPPTAITNTSLLLNYTNAGIIDNTMINNLETVGNAQISTAQSKFGGSSMYFDGTGDYLKTPSSPNLGFGTSDFTVECWINTSTKNIVILDPRISNIEPGVFFIQSTTGFIGYYDNTVGSLSGTTNVTTGAWFHLAWTRSGTTFRMFVNGTQEYSGTNSGNFGASRPAVIGASWEISAFVNGYIDDLRITKGYARYTSNFSPPTSSLLSQ